MMRRRTCSMFFFFNDTATTEIYTLSLHDALPISLEWVRAFRGDSQRHVSNSPCCFPSLAQWEAAWRIAHVPLRIARSEEHTSELQSLTNLVCRLLLEKKKSWY